MTDLELYRLLIPGHAVVLNDTVLAYIAAAKRRHLESAWGAVYQDAMVWYAAHLIETTPGTGAGSGDAGVVGPVISQKDGDLSRTYAAPASSGGSSSGSLGTTTYGQEYLNLRNSRAATAPSLVAVWP